MSHRGRRKPANKGGVEIDRIEEKAGKNIKGTSMPSPDQTLNTVVSTVDEGVKRTQEEADRVRQIVEDGLTHIKPARADENIVSLTDRIADEIVRQREEDEATDRDWEEDDKNFVMPEHLRGVARRHSVLSLRLMPYERRAVLMVIPIGIAWALIVAIWAS